MRSLCRGRASQWPHYRLPAALQYLNGPHRVAAVPDPKLLAMAKAAFARTRVEAAAAATSPRHHLPESPGVREPTLPGKAAAASEPHIDIEVGPSAGGAIPFTKITLV